MDFTFIPRELFYKERKDLNDFGINLFHSFNGQLYNFLKEELFERLGLKTYQQLVLWIFNEAYCQTTVILYDRCSDENMRSYIRYNFFNQIFIGHEYRKYYRFCQDIVYGLVYIFLERPAQNNPVVKSARIQLREYADNYMNIKSLVDEEKIPKEVDFSPIVLDSLLLKTIDWKSDLNDFDENYVHYIIESLGQSFSEKRLLIESIYNSAAESQEMYKIPYSFDAYLYNKYIEFGGKKNDLLYGTRDTRVINDNFSPIANKLADALKLLKSNTNGLNNISGQKNAKKNANNKKEKKRVKPRETMTFRLKDGVTKSHLTLLYTKLIYENWIEGSEKQFLLLFSGKREEECCLTWKGEFGKSTLVELFKQLISTNTIMLDQGYSIPYILEGHFKDKSGQWLKGLDKGDKPNNKALPLIKECIDILKMNPSKYLKNSNDDEDDNPSVYDKYAHHDLHIKKH